MPNLVTLAQRVSELEGKRRKCKSAPCGRTFAPSGRFDPMALKSDQGPSGLKVWAPGHPRLGCRGDILFLHTFYAAARGGPHVTRGAT